MNKTLVYTIVVILESIIIGLVAKFMNYEVAILTVLVQINCRMLVKDLENKGEQ